MPSLQNCKFGTGCTNDACTRVHPNGKGKNAGETGKNADETANGVQVCRHGENCTRKDTPAGCKFGHPEAPKADANATAAPAKAAEPAKAPKADAKAAVAPAKAAASKADAKRKADFTVSELIAACPALADAIFACPALADVLAAARVAAEATRRANDIVKQFSKSS